MLISADILDVEMNWPIALPGQLSTEGATKTMAVTIKRHLTQ